MAEGSFTYTRLVLVAVAVSATVAWVASDPCIGCGGLTLADGATHAEMEAVEQQVRALVIMGIYATVTVVVLFSVLLFFARWPWMDFSIEDES